MVENVRAADIKHCEEELARLQAEGQGALNRYQAYVKNVDAAMQQILEAAGVWGEVQALDGDRKEAKIAIEARLNQIRQEASKVQVNLEFLQSRDKSPAPSVKDAFVPAPPVAVEVAPDEPPVEEVDEDDEVPASEDEEAALTPEPSAPTLELVEDIIPEPEQVDEVPLKVAPSKPNPPKADRPVRPNF